MRLLSELVRESAAFAAASAHHADNPHRRSEHHTNIALELAAARALALAARPVMPQFAERLWADLGQPAPIDHAEWERLPSLLVPGEPLHLSALGYFSPSLPQDKVLAA